MLFLPDHQIQSKLKSQSITVADLLVDHLNNNKYYEAATILADYICRTPWVLSYIKNNFIEIDDNFSYGLSRVVNDCKQIFMQENPASQSYNFATENFITLAVKHELDCLTHILKSIYQEYPLRSSSKGFANPVLGEILYEIFSLNQKFKELKSVFPAKYSLTELTRREIMRNSDELFIIANEVKKLLNTNMDTLSLIEKLYSFQTRYWQMITSTNMIIIPDYNYRRCINGLSDQPHSLHPFPDFDDDIMMNSLSEYTTFIEASAASTIDGYHTSFGFVHMNHIDDDGNAFQVEFPIIMIDERILSVQHPLLKTTVTYDLEVRSHHDLLHHLIPVYADHFILHHPDAPIEFGGKQENYLMFGKSSRFHKEEYELTLGVGLKQIKESQNALDSSYIDSQIDNLYVNLQNVNKISAELLADNVGEIHAANIVTYLSTIYLSRCLTVYDIKKHNYKNIKDLVGKAAINGLIVKPSEVIERLEAIQIALPGVKTADDFIIFLKNSDQALDTEALLVIDYMREIFMSAEIKNNTFHLGKWEALLWRILCMPQRKQHFAYTARVTAKKYMHFGNDDLISPFELIAKQYAVLQSDIREYEQRYYLRDRTASLLMTLFKTIFIAHRNGIYANSLLQRSITNKEHLSKVVALFDGIYKDLYQSTYSKIDDTKLTNTLSILSEYQDICGDLSKIIFDYIALSNFANEEYKEHIKYKKELSKKIMALG
jgi:hypothetical protein